MATPLHEPMNKGIGGGLARKNHRSYKYQPLAIRRGGGADDNSANIKVTDEEEDKVRISPTSAIANWYMNQLDAHELRTKLVSAAILSLVGDVCAQIIGHYTGKSTISSLDKRRMMAMFMDGLICTGPLLHYVYEMYEVILPTHGSMDQGGDTDDPSTSKRRRFLATLAHVLIDNFAMVIVYIAAIMVCTGIFEGRHAVIMHELKNDLLPAVKVSWKVSIFGYAPMQLLSFHFLPMKLRVLAVNILDVVWVTVMSFVTHRNRH